MGQGPNLAAAASSAASATAAFPLVTPEIPYACDTSHHLVTYGNFQVKPHKITTEETSHEPVVSSPLFLPPRKAQSELISHLAPCLLFSQPHQALSHLEQEQRVLMGPQRCLTTCLLGLVLGAAADARHERLHPSLHPPPISTAASAFAEPCSSRGALQIHSCSGDVLILSGHTWGS